MGKAFVFGDNIDTDAIVPGQYLNLVKPEDLAKVCMDGYKHGFVDEIRTGDVFVAGNNFGCGSSREHAPISIKAAGIACIIACSFSRIFYRNSINIGLPVLESKEAVESIREGDECKVDLATGKIIDVTTGCEFDFKPYSPQLQEIINAGGMVEYVKLKNKQGN